MKAVQEPLLDEIQWRSPPIAQSMGGIQTNTGNSSRRRHVNCSTDVSGYIVLPYFYHSPFFDATSNNAIITTQATYNANLFYLVQTREAFEGRLRTMQGLEFMVSQDPSDNGQKVDHNGVWVIKKQNRRKRQGMDDEITPISSYFVVGENIYMAPSIGNVLESRLVRFLEKYFLDSGWSTYLAFGSIFSHENAIDCICTTIVYAFDWSYLFPSGFSKSYFWKQYADIPDKQRKYSNAWDTRYGQ